MTKKIIAALLAASALVVVWETATAAPYNLVGYYRRSSVGGSGVLYSVMFKAGTDQGCLGPPYGQPCYDTSHSWTSSNGVAAAVIAAGPPTWDWNGTTLTATGLFWGTTFYPNVPTSDPTISDKVENLTITPSTSTTDASSYACIEGTWLSTFGVTGCKNTNYQSEGDESIITYNVDGNPKCVTLIMGGDDIYREGTSNPRGLTAQTVNQAGVGCSQTSGAFDLWRVIRDDGTYLILANIPYLGTCYLFGTANSATPPCPNDLTYLGAGYLVFVAAGAPDTDGDLNFDGLDNCPSTANASQSDKPDGDGIGDVCDPDDDNDIVADGSDNCPLNANWNQRNTDGDAFGDVCDTDLDGDGLLNNSFPFDSDDDADGFADGSDNCSLVPNANQANADGDDLGDACDNCTMTANTDLFTVVVAGTQVPKNQLDSDRDGYGNICDADLNNSGLTTATDFNLLRGVLNQSYIQSAFSARADMNASGLVTATDFNLLRARINTAPGPSGLH